MTEHSSDSWRSRIRGCLLGGALGDAIGRPFEGRDSVTPAQVDGVLQAAPLSWTDDTSLMLALAEHLAASDDPAAVDDDGIARALAVAWRSDPGRGYGANPPRVFRAVLAGEDWRAVVREAFGGKGSLGNGGAMRAAPTAAVTGDLHVLADIARRSAAVTHTHPEGQDGAAAIAVAARVCLEASSRQVDPALLLRTVGAVLRAPALVSAVAAVAETLDTDDPHAVAERTGSGVAAAEAVPAAVSAFLHHPGNPLAAIRFAVLMGGDTDTVATMAGCLAGALAGEEALPRPLVSRLEGAARIRRVADALAARTGTGAAGAHG